MIHSDDAGLCTAVNKATIDAMEKGTVSSASIMTPCPGFDEIADYAVSHPDKDFGIHITLTCENTMFRWGPVSPRNEVPSLLRPDGTLWEETVDLVKNAKVDEAEKEIRAQIRKAADRGIAITHLDHHMSVLLHRMDFLKLYVRLGEEFRVPIRLHRNYEPTEFGDEVRNHPDEYKAIVQSHISKGFPVLDMIEMNNYRVQPDLKRGYFLDQVRNLKPGVSEFCIHCSYLTPRDKQPNSAVYRDADTRVFMSLDMQDEIHRQGIRVVDWNEIMTMNKTQVRGGL